MSDFETKLSVLVSKETAAAHNNPDRMGVIIERLINSLALAIAVAAKGDPKGMETFLRGAESYLYESASSYAKLAQFMAACREEPRP